MRLSVLLFLAVATIAVSCINLTTAANGDNTVRRLKGQTSTEEAINAEDEERAGWADLSAKVKGGQLDDLVAKVKVDKVDDVVTTAGGNKLQQAAAKLKAQNAAKAAEEAAVKATATGGNKWQQALAKMKANNFKNLDDIAAPAVNQNRWQAAVAKIKSGQLNTLDTANNRWQSAFNKLKATGQLKNVDEAQVVKVTEGMAKEIAKAPEKSSKFKKFMEITFGVALTALIVVGFNAMIS